MVRRLEISKAKAHSLESDISLANAAAPAQMNNKHLSVNNCFRGITGIKNKLHVDIVHTECPTRHN